MLQGRHFMDAMCAITARSCEKMWQNMWSVAIWISVFPALTCVATHFAVEQNWGPTLSQSMRHSMFLVFLRLQRRSWCPDWAETGRKERGGRSKNLELSWVWLLSRLQMGCVQAHWAKTHCFFNTMFSLPCLIHPKRQVESSHEKQAWHVKLNMWINVSK